MITDNMIRAAAQLLHVRLSDRIPEPRRKRWDQLRPSTRKVYLDIAHDTLAAAGKAAKRREVARTT
jgi:hypothetical protein